MPAIESVTGSGYQSSGSTISGTLPGTINEGDLLHLTVRQGHDGGTPPTFTTPSGWELIGSVSMDWRGRVSTYRRVAGASESAPSISTDTLLSAASAITTVIRISDHGGFDTDALASDAALVDGSGGSADSPSILPSENGSLIVSVLSGLAGVGTAPTVTIPSELDSLDYDVWTSWVGGEAVASAVQETAASTTAMAWSGTNADANALFSFAVSPSGASPRRSRRQVGFV